MVIVTVAAASCMAEIINVTSAIVMAFSCAPSVVIGLGVPVVIVGPRSSSAPVVTAVQIPL